MPSAGRRGLPPPSTSCSTTCRRSATYWLPISSASTPVGKAGDLRVFLGIGTLVRGIAIDALAAGDEQIDVVGLELDTSSPALDNQDDDDS